MLKQYVTFVCDQCGQEYLIDEALEAPPEWLVVNMNIVNTEGYVNEDEREKMNHFCGVICLKEFLDSEDFKTRVILSDLAASDDSDGMSGDSEVQ